MGHSNTNPRSGHLFLLSVKYKCFVNRNLFHPHIHFIQSRSLPGRCCVTYHTFPPRNIVWPLKRLLIIFYLIIHFLNSENIIVLTSLLMNELKFLFQIPLRNKSQFCKWQQKEMLSLLHALRAIYLFHDIRLNAKSEFCSVQLFSGSTPYWGTQNSFSECACITERKIVFLFGSSLFDRQHKFVRKWISGYKPSFFILEILIWLYSMYYKIIDFPKGYMYFRKSQSHLINNEKLMSVSNCKSLVLKLKYVSRMHAWYFIGVTYGYMYQ